MPNRLALEDSPYLQQHKDNPFDWYPWCDEAFEKAKLENKPIFISIGYSSCHWCHVMGRDVFESEEIARYVNDRFICIKVDREERPDIDKHYQELHMLLNRRAGGWPLSIFCTPENKPFYAATYIPPYNRDRMMGFSELCAIIAQKIAKNDEKLFQNADEIGCYLRPSAAPAEATRLSLTIIDRFLMQTRHNYDKTNGGFSKAPKFPLTSMLETLLLIDRLQGDPEVRRMVSFTLEQMGRGGICDLIDGGFCRYSTDEAWLVPHFEKMGYDNALLCELYAKAGRIYGNDGYLQIARESAEFMLRFMSEDDLFYSASDADSEGEEGKYFVYTYDEILSALKQCDVADPENEAERLGASPEGNFEGRCILRLSSFTRPEWFETVRSELQTIRKKRSYPFVDRKIITAWNAMIIKALFVLGHNDERYRLQAIRSLERLTQTMNAEGSLKHSGMSGKAPKNGPFLEDYAYVCAAYLEAYQSTLEERYLIEAQRLANKALELFYERGKWYFSRGVFTTDAEFDDGTYPSAMAVMVDVLQDLGALVDEKYRHFAFKSLEYASLKLMKTPVYYPSLTAAAIRHLSEDRIVTLSKVSLHETILLHYPFARLRRDDTHSQFQICGENTCFATVAEADKLDETLAATL